MSRLRRLLVWLRRSKYSRGFGVQSPWAYRFIRYVVNEHYPYYAYDDLFPLFGHLPRKILKLSRLYFRIANYWQADQALDYRTNVAEHDNREALEAYSTFMKTGCKKLEIVPVHHADDFSSVRLMRLSLSGDYRSVFEKAVSLADDSTLIIVEHIKRDKETKTFWKSILDDPRCVSTFDLYYCGIIFFDKKRYKENYVVNF